jgi:hypothetical protein
VWEEEADKKMKKSKKIKQKSNENNAYNSTEKHLQKFRKSGENFVKNNQSKNGAQNDG